MENIGAQPNGPHEKSTFTLPIPIDGLESELVRLIPFEPLHHASTFYAESAPHPTLYRYLPFGPFNTPEEFLAWHRTRIEEDVASFLFAVFDKNAVIRAHSKPATSDTSTPVNTLNLNSSSSAQSHPLSNSSTSDTVDSRSLAGIIGYLNTNPQHATTELGYLIILPRFQGTYVSRHIGMLLKYALEIPESGGSGSGGMSEHNKPRINNGAIGGLGLRRVQYQANASNVRSIRAAERVGFMKEGVIRWQRVLGSEKEGKSGRDGERAWSGRGQPRWGPGRDTVLLAVCWDDWENGVRERVDQVMRGHA